MRCSSTMEALGEALSCPVCLELFTPPVLVLTCAHNFCKQCLEKILIRQNCRHVNGQFCCPMCRKDTVYTIRELGISQPVTGPLKAQSGHVIPTPSSIQVRFPASGNLSALGFLTDPVTSEYDLLIQKEA